MDWLVEHGFSESMGARPMARLIQEKLKKPLAEQILFGELANGGGEVSVSAKDDDIVISIKARQGKEEKELSEG